MDFNQLSSIISAWRQPNSNHKELEALILDNIRNNPDFLVICMNYIISQQYPNPIFKQFAIAFMISIIKQKPDFVLAKLGEMMTLLSPLLEQLDSNDQIFFSTFLNNLFNIFDEKRIGQDMQIKIITYFQDNNFFFPLSLFCITPSSLKKYHNEISGLLPYMIIKALQSDYDLRVKRRAIQLFSQCLSHQAVQEIFKDIISELLNLIRDFSQKGDFVSIWCDILKLNDNFAKPFFEIAIQIIESYVASIQSGQSLDSISTILVFIENHPIFINIEHIPLLINAIILYQVHEKTIDESIFSFFDIFSHYNFEVFNYTYCLLQSIYSDDKINILVIIMCLSSLIDVFNSSIDLTKLDEILQLCHSLIENCDIDVAIPILKLLQVICMSLNYLACPNKILFLIFKIMDYSRIPFVLNRCLYVLLDFDQFFPPYTYDSEKIFNIAFSYLLQNIDNLSSSYCILILMSYIRLNLNYEDDKYFQIANIVSKFLTIDDINLKISAFCLYFEMYISFPNLFNEPFCNLFSQIINVLDNFKQIEDYIFVQQFAIIMKKIIDFYGNQAIQCIQENNIIPRLFDSINYLSIFLKDTEKIELNFHTIGICYYFSKIIISLLKNYREILPKNDVTFLLRAGFKMFSNKPKQVAENQQNLIFEYGISLFQKIVLYVNDLSCFVELYQSINKLIYNYFTKNQFEDALKYITPLKSIMKILAKETVDEKKVETAIKIRDNYIELISKLFQIFNFNIIDKYFQLLSVLTSQNVEIIHKFFDLSFKLFKDNYENDNILYFFEYIRGMIQYNTISSDELEISFSFFSHFLQKVDIVQDPSSKLKNVEFNCQIYIALSHFLNNLDNPTYQNIQLKFFSLKNLLYNNWEGAVQSNLSIKYILNTLLLMTFNLIPTFFEQEKVSNVIAKIMEDFQISKATANQFLKHLILFLENHNDLINPALPIFIKYLSYHKFIYCEMNVDIEVHEKILNLVKTVLPQVENFENLLSSCFGGSLIKVQSFKNIIGLT